MENLSTPHKTAENILPGKSTDSAMAPVGSEANASESVGFEECILRRVLEHAGEALIVCDTSGSIIRASHGVHRYCHHHYLNRPFDEIFHLSVSNARMRPSAAPSPNLSKTYLSRILSGELLRNEAVCLTQEDGTCADVLFGGYPLQDEDQNIIGALMTFGGGGPLLPSEYILKRHNEVLENIIAGRPLFVIYGFPLFCKRDSQR